MVYLLSLGIPRKWLPSSA